MIAETKSASTFAVRRFIVAALTAALLACRPGADFKVSVRVIDETTGRPIPDAWVLVSARVDVEPERDPPYNRAIAGARDRTDSRGVAVLRTLEGLYWGEEPKDELWKMLAAREPKVERRITLIKEGDLFVFAKDYGVLHHPLRFKGGSSKEVPGLGLMGVKGEGAVLELDPADMAKGLALTIKMAKPEDTEYLLGSFSPDSLWLFAGLATTGATGTTKKEKAAVYDFFVENLRPLLSRSTAAYHGHMRPESLFDPENREKFINHAPEQVHNHDTTIHAWMTQKALELLPPGYEEVKQYAREIQAGVKAEDEGTRAINHFYNPYDPGNAFPLGESALKWGAIGYPDNPNNEWDWHDAQRYYREGDKAKAYKALGHVLHLLEDLSVPMHTHVIAHHSVFQRSAARYELYFGELAKANGGRLPPIYGMDARAPKKVHAPVDLFDGLAKMTFGRIEGDRAAVDVAAFYKWEKGSMGSQGREPDAAALDILGKRLIPAGIEHGAGLMVKYFADLHPAASVAVTDQGTASDAGGQESSTMTLREVFRAIDAAPNDEAAHGLFLKLAAYQADNEADLIKAYGLAKRQQAAKGDAVEKARQRMAYAVSIITKATATHQQEWVARLLTREAPTLPSNAPGLWGAESQQDRLEQSLRFGPAGALIEAALTGKNRSALPALRLVFEKGGMIGKHADLAINEIGDPEDLERAVAHIKRDPEDPISLSGFSDLVVPRFIKEIENPNLSEELRVAFIGRLGAGARLGNCPPYLALLKHKHPLVREVATQNLRMCLTRNDEALILRLLSDSDRDIQLQALSAIDEKIWHPKHVPVFIGVLENAPNEHVRARAASILGRRRVSEAIPALQRGLQSKSSKIRRACRIALQDLGINP